MQPGGVLRVALIGGLLAAWLLYRRYRRSVTAGTWALVLVVAANLLSTIVRRGAKPGGLWETADPRLVVVLTNVTIVFSLLGLVLFRLFVEGYTDVRAILRRMRGPLLVAAAAIVVFVSCAAVAAAAGDPMLMYNRPDITLPAGIFALTGRLYMSWVFAETCWWAVRWLRRTSLLTRIGLVFVAVGTLILAACTLIDSAAAAASLFGFTVPDTHAYVAGSDSLGGIVLLVGIVLPVLLGRVQALVVWVRYWWLHRQLAPLWRAVGYLYPEIVLVVAPQRGPGTAARRRFRVHRQVTECADGLTRLVESTPESDLAAGLVRLTLEYYPALVTGRAAEDVDLAEVIASDTRQLVRLSKAVRRQLHVPTQTAPTAAKDGSR